MNFTWEEYNYDKHYEIDLWNNQNPYIDMYAMYGDTLSTQARWYKNNPNDPISNYQNKIFVVKNQEKLIAFIISNMSIKDGKFYTNINPIVVNPTLINQGYGTKVLTEFINNTETLFVEKIEYIMAMLEDSNIPSIKLFIRLGFVEVDRKENFAEYKYYMR